MRVAAVLTTSRQSFEERLITRRFVSALRCSFDVEVLVAGESPEFRKGAKLPVRFFPKVEISTAARRALISTTVGTELPWRRHCECVDLEAIQTLNKIPEIVQWQLAHSQGGHSPDLCNFLESSDYEAVVFIGYKSATTLVSAQRLPERCRAILLPMARRDPLLNLPIYDAPFARAERVLVLSETEARLVASRMGDGGRVRNVGFALRVDNAPEEGRVEDHTTPRSQPKLKGDPYFAVVGEGSADHLREVLKELFLAAHLGVAVRVVVLTPQPISLPSTFRMQGVRYLSRADMYRWLRRARAFIDVSRNHVFAPRVVEAMLCGKTVIVPENSGVPYEHVSDANAGLWFRNALHLGETFRFLLEDEKASNLLGTRAKAYAEARFGDVDGFIERVRSAVES